MTPVALADRYSGQGLYLHQHAERVCAERGCGAPVREQRATIGRSRVTVLVCVAKGWDHAGHMQAVCSHGDAA